MSNWPNGGDYLEAMQHPARFLRDPRLQAYVAETDKWGRPKPSSGQFAIVCKLKNGTDEKAIKFFLYPQPKREGRYQAISDYLKERGRPTCLVDFHYDPRGVRIKTDWYPVQVMDWVRGVTLDKWVGQTVQAGDRQSLLRMAERWVKLLEELWGASICHGDLQHGNVMVVGDVPVLVDYDGMCVPALVNHDALEEGRAGYQHPRRPGQKLSLDLDRFSAWIIMIALRALAADLTLWQRYGEPVKNENLLFTEKDILEPGASRLWPELFGSPDAEVQSWARQLHATLPARSLTQIPPFQLDPFQALRAAWNASPRDWDLIHTLASAPQLAGKTFPRDLQTARPDALQRTAARDRLQQAVNAGSARAIAAAYEPALLDDWAACAHLVTCGREAGKLVKLLDELETARRLKDNGRQLVALWSRYGPQLGAVAEAAPLRAEAERWRLRIDAYDRFRTVLKQPASTERGIANAWDVLAQAGGHPDADGDRPRAEQAHRRADLLDQVRPVAVAETEDNDRQLDRLWDSVLLTGCPERDALKPRVQAARGRLQTLAALQTAIDEANRGVGDEERVAAVAASLPVGYPHRNVQRVAQARVRVKLTEDFLKVVQNPSASDRDVADAWDRLTSHGKLPRAAAVHRSRAEQARARVELLDRLRALPAVASEDNDRQFDRLWDEALLTNCAEAATLRPCHQDMRRRLEVLDALQQIIAQVDRGAAREEQILSAAASLPSGYAHRLAGRVKVAYQRAALKSELSRALEATPPLDRVIARVWEKVRAAGSLRLDKVVIERCTVAVQRRDCLDRLDAIDADLPLDQQDAEWLRLWDEELLRHCHDADAAHVRYTQAVERRAAWQALEKALAEGNAKQVRKLATDPLLTDYPPLLAAAPQIHDLLHRAEAAEHIFAVLAEGKVGAFTADDLRFIAEHEELFKAHKTQIVELLERWLVTEGRLEKLATPFVVNLPEGTVTARWTWPHFGRISYCLVAADARRFYERPEDCKTYRLTAEGHRPNTGIVLPVSPRGQSQLRVTVWPVIDLKWCKVTGARLIMGPPTTGGGGGQR